MNTTRLFALAGGLWLSGFAFAQVHSAQPPAPAQPERAPEPTLDDLLGLTKPTDAKAGDNSPSRAELDRKLGDTPEDPDPFAQAVALMHQATDRLSKADDPGVQTQRLQDQVIEKLDRLIAEAQKNKNQKNKSKSKPKPNDGSQKPEQQQSSQNQPAPSNQAGNPSVARQDGELRPPPPSAAASWGDLPQRERDLLTQGLSDRFSAVYRQLTEEYYKRLAEQGGQR
ncbi:MAG: hypothetical protein GC200_00900 [Tepidisphaera sp.]|nr:hypothetical protein [Tepidisphaera sp.]